MKECGNELNKQHTVCCLFSQIVCLLRIQNTRTSENTLQTGGGHFTWTTLTEIKFRKHHFCLPNQCVSTQSMTLPPIHPSPAYPRPHLLCVYVPMILISGETATYAWTGTIWFWTIWYRRCICTIRDCWCASIRCVAWELRWMWICGCTAGRRDWRCSLSVVGNRLKQTGDDWRRILLLLNNDITDWSVGFLDNLVNV